MQAPKDGDSPEYLTELHGLQKRLEDHRTSQDRGEPSCSFATRSCDSGAAKRMSDAFTRGFHKGLAPLQMLDLRIEHRADADVTRYSTAYASVSVSGLELVQAADPEALGHAKGEYLRRLTIGQGVGLPIPGTEGEQKVEAASPEGAYGVVTRDVGWQRHDAVPAAPQVAAWSGGASPEGNYGMLRVNLPDGRREVCYVRVDVLSTVLHELAGQASLCWHPKPTGVFDSATALSAVADTLKRLGV